MWSCCEDFNLHFSENINHIIKRKLPSEIVVHFLTMLWSSLQLPFVSVLFRRSHLLTFISLPFDKSQVDGGAYQIARFTALLSAAGLGETNLYYLLFESFVCFYVWKSIVRLPRYPGGLLQRKCVTLPEISNAFPADAWTAWSSILIWNCLSLVCRLSVIDWMTSNNIDQWWLQFLISTRFTRIWSLCVSYTIYAVSY